MRPRKQRPERSLKLREPDPRQELEEQHKIRKILARLLAVVQSLKQWTSRAGAQNLEQLQVDLLR